MKLLFIVFLGVILLNVTVSAARISGYGGNGGNGKNSQQKPQNDPVDNEEESCEDDGNDTPQGPVVRKNKPQRDVAPDDDDGVIDDPTDDDYLRYENPRENGICLLQRGKCPNGDWKMFQRKNETVCLKLFGSPYTVDRLTASKICRQNSNARLMMVDSHKEREWMWSLPIHNGTYLTILLSGYRNRKCKVDPNNAPCREKLTSFVNEDGTADPAYAFTMFSGGPFNGLTDGRTFDDCPMLQAAYLIQDMVNVVRDWKCKDFNTFLCGITVM